MGDPAPAGGPTQDEVMAVSLFKMGIRHGDSVLDCGCGTGKVAIAAARVAKMVYAVDRRPEAIRYARQEASAAGVTNIEFFCGEAWEFLSGNRIFDCAFVGGTKEIDEILPLLAQKVKRTIVVNVVMVGTLSRVVETMLRLGIFREAVHVQVSRSQPIAGSIMFRPIDPVSIVVGSGTAC
jgi:cobalt-precorrin-6B (C15)-methyltransferase